MKAKTLLVALALLMVFVPCKAETIVITDPAPLMDRPAPAIPEEFFYTTISPDGLPELSFTRPDPVNPGPGDDARWDAFARFVVIGQDQGREGPLATAYFKAMAQMSELELPDYVTLENFQHGSADPRGEKVRAYLREQTDRVIREQGIAEFMNAPFSQEAYDEVLARFPVAPVSYAPDDLFSYCPGANGVRAEEAHPHFSAFSKRLETDSEYRERFEKAVQRFRGGQDGHQTIEAKNAYLHQVLREENILPVN